MGWEAATGKSTIAKDHVTITANTSKLFHVLLGKGEEPYSYWTHFVKSANRVIICPGRDICPICIDGVLKSRSRHAMNVYDYDSKSVKIFECGVSVIRQLKILLDQYGSFEDIDVSIRRMGEGLDTQYYVMPVLSKVKFMSTGLIKFNLPEIKKKTPIETIHKIIRGTGEETPTNSLPNTAQCLQPISEVEMKELWNEPLSQTELPQPQPQPQTTYVPPTPVSTLNEETILTFGKYKGKTFAQVADIDISYLTWCSNNLTDATLKKEACETLNTRKNINVARVVEQPPPKPQTTTLNEYVVEPQSKQALMQEVYNIINTDNRYKNNFSLVVAFMRQSSESPTHPAGKTVLSEYTEEELSSLKNLLTKGGDTP